MIFVFQVMFGQLKALGSCEEKITVLVKYFNKWLEAIQVMFTFLNI